MREPFHLPIKSISETPQSKQIKLTAALVVAAAKRCAISSLHGKEIDLDEQISTILENLWQKAYSKGISHADKMHYKIDGYLMVKPKKYIRDSGTAA